MSLVRYRPKPSDRIPATRSDDSAGSATGHRAGPNDTDWESEALIAQLRLEDLEDQARYLPRRHDGGPTDEHLACITQQEELKEWIRYIEDMRYATDLQSLTPLPMANVTPAVVQEDTTAAMLNELAITERAAEDDRRAAQCLQDGQPLPPMTDNQKWVERRAAERESSPKSAPLPSLNPMRPAIKAADSTLTNGKGKGKEYPKVVSWLQDDDTDSSDIDQSSFDHNVQWEAQMKAFRGNATRKTAEEPGPSTNPFERVGFAREISSLLSSGFYTPSIPSSPTPRTQQDEKVECTICMEQIKKKSTLKMPCDHYYCHGCLMDLIETFNKDESLYPLRCCQQPIPPGEIIPLITSKKLRQTFERKSTEYSIPSKERVYCCTSWCSTFLGGSAVGGAAHDDLGIGIVCFICEASTCPHCGKESHIDSDCVPDEETEQVKTLAKQEGWQTCPGCQSIVELHHGCYHITCRCQFQFCYVCAVQWKDCQCPQWDEARLLDTAHRRVENQLGTVQLRRQSVATTTNLVQRMMTDLRVNHNCTVHSWSYRLGEGQCEECHWHAPKFLFICRACNIIACYRCSRNRL